MKVLLKEDVNKLGSVGDEVEVKDGCCLYPSRKRWESRANCLVL